MSSSFEQAAEVLGRFFAPLGLPELVVGGGLGVPYVNGESAPTPGRVGGGRPAPHAPAPAWTRRSRISAEPGRSIVATAGLTLYTVGTVKKLPGIRTYVSVDGGMSDNPAAGPLRQRLRGVLAPRGRARRGRSRSGWWASTARAATWWCRNAFVPEDLRVGDVVATPVTGAYGYAMASNYNKVPRPAVVFVADGSARVVVAARDPRRHDPTRRVRRRHLGRCRQPVALVEWPLRQPIRRPRRR